MNEADTRAQLIDKQLEDAGWTPGGEVQVFREHKINHGEIRVSGPRKGRLTADYVLAYRNVKLAVVEAKSDEVDVSEGVAQAKIYAQKLCLQMSFAANGKRIYQIDHATGSEGDVSAFPSPQELWRRTQGATDDWLRRFYAVPFEDMGGTRPLRYYQELAVNRAVKAIANGERRVLLTLATGTGKTFIAAQVAWKLFQCRWTLQKDAKRRPRILFLADRNILADQALLDFGAFDDEAMVRIDPKNIAKRGEVPKNGSVFFTIFQTFMSGKDGKPYFGEYEPDFFDLVVVDECHRGGANDESTWRGILDHFSAAVHLGLTATPKRDDNVDTYDYFGEPVFTYSLKEGIGDGFLTPFKVKRIQTTLDEYVYTPDDDVLEGEVEPDRVYKERDFNKLIEIEARERRRVREMLAAVNRDEKTIVFCANQAHAALVRDFINQEADSGPVDYCVRVTANDGAIGDMYLKQFRDNDKSIPTVLTTSRKLSTGVDARNVRNIVLLRPVNNMIEFKQIIGRGTRLFEGKRYFTIVDFVDAYHHFNDEEWDGEAVDVDAGGDGGDDETAGAGKDYGTPDGGGDDEGLDESPPMVRIRLSDGKVREIQSTSSTYFYVDGKPVGAKEFLERLFDDVNLPDLLGSEEDLRRLWANPVTRRELMQKLEKAGCGKDDLEKLQELIDAKDSDLFDVLEYIAYAKPPVSRVVRVKRGKDDIFNLLSREQREFVGYVLGNYVEVGVDELDLSKLPTALKVKYGGTHAAEQALGAVDDIRRTFIDFQRHLYKAAA